MRRFTPKYNHEEAEELLARGRQMRAILNNMPLWQRELAQHKINTAIRRRTEAKRPEREQLEQAREGVEQQAVETLKQCIASLQMALDALNHTPAPPNHQSLINPRALVNLLQTMRTKCGPRFNIEEIP